MIKRDEIKSYCMSSCSFYWQACLLLIACQPRRTRRITVLSDYYIPPLVWRPDGQQIAVPVGNGVVILDADTDVTIRTSLVIQTRSRPSPGARMVC